MLRKILIVNTIRGDEIVDINNEVIKVLFQDRIDVKPKDRDTYLKIVHLTLAPVLISLSKQIQKNIPSAIQK